MNVVSLLGYSHACIALAAVVACAWTRRTGVALVVIVALTAALTDIAKATWRAPRPESVDARVQHLSIWQLPRGPDTAPEVDAEDRFGFPSGHVAATMALALGIAAMARRRWAWISAGVWIALMAVSRMYLGRHFLGDVLGGFVVGAITLAIGRRLFHRSSWLLGVAAAGLDCGAKRVHLKDGRVIDFDRLLIATGGRARPWHDPVEARLDGVFTLRVGIHHRLFITRINGRVEARELVTREDFDRVLKVRYRR